MRKSFSQRNYKNKQFTATKTLIYTKFGDGDGPNLCRVNKVDVSSTFY